MTTEAGRVDSKALPFERYQFKPHPGSSHSWALAELMRVEATHKVLDIGSGSGEMGRSLRAQGVEQVYAVEIDEASRAHVQDVYLEVHEALEPFQGKQFDVILLLDVLEHVPDVARFYRVACDLLRPGGFLLVSVPNIAHWSIRLLLLLGLFPAMERGILDRTHLHHFTRSRIRDFLQSEPDMKIEQIEGSVEPLELMLPRWAWDNPVFGAYSQARQLITQVHPGLFSYQHLAKVTKG